MSDIPKKKSFKQVMTNKFRFESSIVSTVLAGIGFMELGTLSSSIDRENIFLTGFRFIICFALLYSGFRGIKKVE